jgi:hypothetical protein
MWSLLLSFQGTGTTPGTVPRDVEDTTDDRHNLKGTQA